MERCHYRWSGAALALGLLLCAPALAQMGQVSALRGAASALRATGAVALDVEAPVFRGDTLRVAARPADSQLEVRLTDGSLLRVDAGAELLLIDYAPDQPEGVLDLIRGHVWLEVKRTFSRRRNAFRVRTRHGVAGVQGTRFGIDSRTERTLFKVFEGRVSVSGRDGRQIRVLTDGDSLVLDARGVVTAPVTDP